MSTESVMPSNHLILCHPLLLLPSIFPSIRVFSLSCFLGLQTIKAEHWEVPGHPGPIVGACCPSPPSSTSRFLLSHPPRMKLCPNSGFLGSHQTSWQMDGLCCGVPPAPLAEVSAEWYSLFGWQFGQMRRRPFKCFFLLTQCSAKIKDITKYRS